jgi:hypothetical protein
MTKINELSFRALIQKKDGSKNIYTPSILQGNITHYYPFAVSVANLTLNLSIIEDSAYITPWRIDDIIRIQIREQKYDDNKVPWQDIFHGRIHSITAPYNINGNNVSIKCLGHGESLNRCYTSSDKTYTSKTTGYIINDIIYEDSRMTDNSFIDMESSNLSSYEIKGNAKSVQQTINELERLENLDYKFSLVPVYSGNILSEVSPKWSPVKNNKFVTLQENNNSFISASFSTKNEIVNNVYIYGDGSPQVSGSASNSTSQGDYGVRTTVIVDKSLSTSNACTEAAEAILERYKDPIITGTVTTVGNPNIVAGDNIKCIMPSIVANGTAINGWYMINRVTHTFGNNTFTTSISVGEKDLNMSEIINYVVVNNRLNNLNGID